jgi:hypothetical protein
MITPITDSIRPLHPPLSYRWSEIAARELARKRQHAADHRMRARDYRIASYLTLFVSGAFAAASAHAVMHNLEALVLFLPVGVVLWTAFYFDHLADQERKEARDIERSLR